MDIETRRAKLMNLGVNATEMYIFPARDNRQLLILRRTALDKLELSFGIQFKYISVTESSYGGACNVTVVLQGEAIVDGHRTATQALGSANPDTVSRTGFIADMANKRARHKIILKVADLYQYDVHSEEESEDFKPSKQFDSNDAVSEAMKKINV